MNTTKQCSQCKKEVDLKAKKCSHCQSDLRSWFARHKILTGIGGFILFFMIIVAIGDSNSTLKKAKENVAMEKVSVEQKVIFDISGLLWKNLEDAKKVLGEPTKIITSENSKIKLDDTDAIWEKDGEKLYITYVIKTGKITEAFLFAKNGEDKKDDANDTARIVRKMNLNLKGDNYKVEFTGPVADKIFTGAKVVFFDPLESSKETNARHLINRTTENIPLKAPSTAKWTKASYASKTKTNTFEGSGYVDSQNGFGAMIRSNWSITVQYIGPEEANQIDYIDHRNNWKILSLKVDGVEMYK